MLKISKRYYSVFVKCNEGKDIPKLCKDCKFMKPNYTYLLSKSKYEFGRCTKKFKVDVVDGTILYEYANVVREFECKGEWFEEKKKIF